MIQSDNAFFNKLLPALVLTSLLILSCAYRVVKKEPDCMRMILISNTFPESPFHDLSKMLKIVFKEINRDNPIFVIHLGDMIHGGKEWMGIHEKGIIKQFNQFFSYARILKPILHIVKGEKDTYNDSADIFSRYSKRKNYYSFNYGSIHCIILDSIDTTPGEISDQQMNWLEADLIAFKDSHAIFIFLHHSLIRPKKNYSNIRNIICKNSNTLHKIFIKYPVKAVFSGHLPFPYQNNRDGILYINTGCGNYNKSDQYKKYYNYYIVEYCKKIIRLSAKKISYDYIRTGNRKIIHTKINIEK